MKQPIDYIEDLKEKFGSDYKATKALNTGKSTIPMIRQRNQISDETAIKIADALGIDRDEVLIAAAIARSEGTAREAWIDHARRFGIAASTALFMVETLTPTILSFKNCILCQIVNPFRYRLAA